LSPAPARHGRELSAGLRRSLRRTGRLPEDRQHGPVRSRGRRDGHRALQAAGVRARELVAAVATAATPATASFALRAAAVDRRRALLARDLVTAVRAHAA